MIQQGKEACLDNGFRANVSQRSNTRGVAFDFTSRIRIEAVIPRSWIEIVTDAPSS